MGLIGPASGAGCHDTVRYGPHGAGWSPEGRRCRRYPVWGEVRQDRSRYLKRLQVSEQELAEAKELVPEELKQAIRQAKNNIEIFHASQRFTCRDSQHSSDLKRLIFPSDLSASPQTPCPSAFRLKNWGYGILQPSGNVSAGFIFGGVVVLKDIFRLKHFVRYILQPECRRAGCLRRGWKIWRKNKAFRHVDTVMEKNNRSNFKKLLFFQWKRLVLFFKDLVLFRKEQDVWKVSNLHVGRLVTCGATRY